MIARTTKTVRDLAVELPGATRVFEKLKIDYCCGGERTLEVACEIAGVETKDVWQLLEAEQTQMPSEQTTNFQGALLTELIQHILDKHHVFTRAEMVRLDALIEKVCSVHGQNHRELLRVKSLFKFLSEDLEPHMAKEESVLFPYIIKLEEAALQKETSPAPPFGTVKNPVRIMMLEHETVGSLLRDLRDASAEYSVPADGCISYQTLYQALGEFEGDLHQHIHLENNILFPRAIAMENATYSS
ncbi:MAG: regulator of cell morphosis and signaling [Acidobacteriota bacterium]|jgi:regulator of cell morphogenesis and NO signaling|nr:regulator of cell morphosis and signaling [Acidobacteriota bacterium]